MVSERVTDLGIVPEDWKITKLSKVCTVNPTYKITDGELCSYIDMASVDEESPNPRRVELKSFRKSSCSKFKSGDILFARITPCTENGKTALLKKLPTEHGFGSTEFIVLSPHTSKLDSVYLYYLVKDSRIRNKAIARMIGTTGRQRVPNEFFKDELVIGIPPLPEQRKIAAILTSVDEAIEKTEAIIKQTEKVKKGLMQRLLTKGIGHTKFKKTEIGEIPEEWKIVKIEEVVTNIIGGGTPSRKIEQFYKGNIPWVTVKDLKHHELDTAMEFISEEAVINSATNIIPAGNVIVATRMAIGKAFKNLVDVAINQDLKALIPISKLITTDFLLWSYLNKSEQIESLGSGTTVKGIRLEQLKEIKIALPSLAEQQKIVSIITTVDKKLNVEQKYLRQLQTIKEGLMQVLLTGKVRVKVDEDAEVVV